MNKAFRVVVEFEMGFPSSYTEEDAEEFIRARVPFPQHTVVEGTLKVDAQALDRERPS